MMQFAVVGCGVIGLTTALALQKKFRDKAKITIFSKDFSPNTTGDLAAGLWTPYLMQNTPEDDIIRWSKKTQDYLLQLWRDGKAEEYGISLHPILVFTDQKDFEAPKWTQIAIGLHNFDSEELQKFKVRFKNANIKAGYSFVGFTWEASIFLPRLQHEFTNAGGGIIHREIFELEELQNFDVIVNCTGIGARYLVNDRTVLPLRGQVTRIKAPWQYHVVMLDTEEGNYVIPNVNSVILGGTHQSDFSREVYEEDVRHIIDGCSQFVPALRKAELVEHGVGLRPGRERVRLEVAHRVNDKGSLVHVVHNYGHGGCGITLSIGCAEDVVELVVKALRLQKNKL